MTSVIDRFYRRLKRLGIDITLAGNYPWVYLDTVNGVRVTEKFQANHGFTAFFEATKVGTVAKFSDRRRVFQKVRSML